jgi:hypothetical protein
MCQRKIVAEIMLYSILRRDKSREKSKKRFGLILLVRKGREREKMNK